VELLLIGLWAFFVGRGYLDFNPRMVPTGTEFGEQIQSNHLWTQLVKCGWCAAWNGSEQGGLPALVDVHGSMLQPVIAATTLFLGVVNGIKVSILLSLWLAGVAQWWMAKELGLGRIPALFTAGIAVAGGHLAGKMISGTFQFIIGGAAAGCASPDYCTRGGDVGPGPPRYWAYALHHSSSPARVTCRLECLWCCRQPPPSIWESPAMIAATGSAWPSQFLCAFCLWHPSWYLWHIFPQLRESRRARVPIRSTPGLYPLNLVINDRGFYDSDILLKAPGSPHFYSLYIGWIPVLLAALGLATLRRKDRRAGWFLALGALLAFFAASAVLPKAVVRQWPATGDWPLVGGLRYPAFMAGLAVPLILGLTAYGLDYVFRVTRNWPRLSLSFSAKGGQLSGGCLCSGCWLSPCSTV